MTPFFPIIIDGPARGKKMAVNSLTFMVEKSPESWFNHYSDYNIGDPVPYFERVVYHVHEFIVGNMKFAVASVKSTPPPAEKMLKKIFTSGAIGARMK